MFTELEVATARKRMACNRVANRIKRRAEEFQDLMSIIPPEDPLEDPDTFREEVKAFAADIRKLLKRLEATQEAWDKNEHHY